MNIRPQMQIVVHDYTLGERQDARRHHREAVLQYRRLMERSGTGPAALLVGDPASVGGFVTRPRNAVVRLLARLGATSLDRRLASGDAPESGRLLAARAERLVSLPVRRSLARRWGDLSAQATRPPVARDPRVPLCRDRILAADPDIRAMVRALSTTLPVPARGVAMANGLIGDGTGPLYNRSSTADLTAALRKVTEMLDPTTALSPR